MFTRPPALARRLLYVLGLVLTAGLLLSACGGGDDDDDDAGGDPPATSEDERASSGETSAITIAPEGDPVEGGELAFGLEAETDGWNPTTNRWAVSGIMVAAAVFDPLAAWNEDGEAEPYLAESFTPNDDFTEWTITLRSGVTFHNGEALTSDAVVQTFEGHLASALTAPALEPVESVEAIDDLNVRVNMNQPWAVFPVVLTGQPGFIPAPEQLEAADSQNAIGTGPFVQQEWTQDAQWVGTKNPDYWREGLPYLDELTFKPIPETETRMASLETGDINMTHTTDDDAIIDWREKAEAGDAQIVEDGSSGEETFVMLNTLVPPLDDVRVREAIALATDKEAYIETTGSGILVPANTPFNPTSPWYSEEAAEAMPQYDPAAAQALVDEYEAEVGPIEFTLGTTPVTANQESISLLAAQWATVGIDAQTTTETQDQFILNAVSGDFEANLWRQFGAPDPDGDYVWWVSQNANEVGEFSLNFARNRDTEIDDAMNAGRESDDPATREEAYATVQERLNEDLPYIWLNHTLWAMIADNSVRYIGVTTLPDGQAGLGIYNGATRFTEVWRAVG
jgi:ABC-type transport system substrate-binding protein